MNMLTPAEKEQEFANQPQQKRSPTYRLPEYGSPKVGSCSAEKVLRFDRKALFGGSPRVKGVQTPKRVYISESIPLGSTRGLFPLDSYLFLYSSSSGFAPLAS